MLGDFNIAKFNIPVSIRKAFNKGEIAKSYRQMYKEAKRASSSDAAEYQTQKLAEVWDSAIKGKQKSPLTFVEEVRKYKEDKFKEHMDRMIHMLELNAKSKKQGAKEK